MTGPSIGGLGPSYSKADYEGEKKGYGWEEDYKETLDNLDSLGMDLQRYNEVDLPAAWDRGWVAGGLVG